MMYSALRTTAPYVSENHPRHPLNEPGLFKCDLIERLVQEAPEFSTELQLPEDARFRRGLPSISRLSHGDVEIMRAIAMQM